MDLSALIFVALAVAWAVYLIPKALKHHEDVAHSRSVERFSHTLRVLAHREPTSRKSARLVVPAGRPAATSPTSAAPVAPAVAEPEPALGGPVVATAAAKPSRAQAAARRTAAARAAKRRLRVVALILLANATVIALAAFSVVAWPYVAIPAGLLVAWLVACRLMVKRERAALVPTRRLPLAPPAPDEVEGPLTEEIAAVLEEGVEEPVAAAAAEAPRDPDAWDLVPVTLPTYVSKEQATRRTVRTIDLDSTGVWTSGRTESDSVLAREAEEAERTAKAARKDGEGRRASGS